MDSARACNRLLKLGLWAAGLAVAIQTIAHFTYAYVWPSLMLNADNDWATFAWASTVVTFSGALAAAVLAAVGPNRWPPAILAVVLTIFSFDDGARMHERLAAHVDGMLPWAQAGRAGGMLLLLPLMIAAFAILWRLSGDADRAPRRHIRIGLALLVLATFLEAVVSTLVRNAGWREFDLPMVIEVVAEEGAELGGWILIVSGLAATALRSLHVRLVSPADPAPATR